MTCTRHRRWMLCFAVIAASVGVDALLLNGFVGVAPGLFPHVYFDGSWVEVEWQGLILHGRPSADSHWLAVDRDLWYWGPRVLFLLWSSVMGAAVGRVVAGLLPRRTG